MCSRRQFSIGNSLQVSSETLAPRYRLEGWQGTAWLLERLYVNRFSKPELQIAIQTNRRASSHNYTRQTGFVDSADPYTHWDGWGETASLSGENAGLRRHLEDAVAWIG
jgi:hypothetical protein